MSDPGSRRQAERSTHAVPSAAVAALQAVLGASNVRPGHDAGAALAGPGDGDRGAGIVVVPSSTDDVAAVVRICAQHAISIVPEGGRTGLVGGSVSRSGQIVLSMARLSRIERLDPIERVAVVDGAA